MKVLVTGGAGFIGSHLVDRLLENGYEVIAIDNLAGGNLQNLDNSFDNPRLSVQEVDIVNLEAIQPLFKGVKRVYHLAGLADIVPSINEPMKYHRANVDGTVAVLEASRREGVDKFVYAASSTCYGLPSTFPTTELEQIRPMYPYALTKYLGEQCVMHWNDVYNMPCVSLRLFNVYGPRSRTQGSYGAVFGVFLAQKLAGQPMTVVGDGNQTRDFTFVTDVVDCFLAVSESDIQGEVFNVGSGGTYSINHLVDLIGGDRVHIPKRPGEPDCTFADIGKIKRFLGWEPKIKLESGVKVMLDNISRWTEAPVWDVDSIAEATQDWFKYLGGDQR